MRHFDNFNYYYIIFLLTFASENIIKPEENMLLCCLHIDTFNSSLSQCGRMQVFNSWQTTKYCIMSSWSDNICYTSHSANRRQNKMVTIKMISLQFYYSGYLSVHWTLIMSPHNVNIKTSPLNVLSGPGDIHSESRVTKMLVHLYNTISRQSHSIL